MLNDSYIEDLLELVWFKKKKGGGGHYGHKFKILSFLASLEVSIFPHMS